MTFLEARDKSLQVEWEVLPCPQGEDCWCRIVAPKTPLRYTEHGISENYFIVTSAQIDTATAEHIVKLHNESISKEQ